MRGGEEGVGRGREVGDRMVCSVKRLFDMQYEVRLMFSSLGWRARMTGNTTTL